MEIGGLFESQRNEARMDTEVLGYTVIYERESEGNWGAYVPDLPGLAGVYPEKSCVTEPT